MALQFALNGTVLHVIESLHGWNNTKTSHWYKDTATWLCSQHGRENDACVQPMDAASIEWCKKYHLPHVMSADQIAALPAGPAQPAVEAVAAEAEPEPSPSPM